MNTTRHDSIADLLTLLASHLELTRPMAAFDLETTGINVDTDRIVQITIGRIDEDLRVTVMETLVHPGCPIPKGATDIHGITDEAVKAEQPFRAIASLVSRMLSGADLVGFNHRRFDVRMIAAECQRVGLPDPCAGARLVDVCRIFHQREPRDLSGAVRFYCNEDHDDAHGTTPDVVATLRVLLAQFERYEDLPRDLDGLHAINRDPSWLDQDGKVRWMNGEACLGFGKHNGVPLSRVDASYLRWLITQDWCLPDARGILRNALRGEYPLPAAPVEA